MIRQQGLSRGLLEASQGPDHVDNLDTSTSVLTEGGVCVVRRHPVARIEDSSRLTTSLHVSLLHSIFNMADVRLEAQSSTDLVP